MLLSDANDFSKAATLQEQDDSQPASTFADLRSPTLHTIAGRSVPAYELKFLVSTGLAERVEDWAENNLQRDQFADSASVGYQTTTLYLDTPNFDVFHRRPKYRYRKLRLRRYGVEPTIYLEQKRRRRDRVKKRRTSCLLSGFEARITANDSEWSGSWFRDRLNLRNLQPACLITYQRMAYVQASDVGAIRLTLDRDVRGMPSQQWEMSPVRTGQAILSDHVILELKYRRSLPDIFKQLLLSLQLKVSAVSKYRRVMEASMESSLGRNGEVEK